MPVQHESLCVMTNRVEKLEEQVGKLFTEQQVTKTKLEQVQSTLLEIKGMLLALQEKREGDNYNSKEVTELVLKYVAVFVSILGTLAVVIGYIL